MGGVYGFRMGLMLGPAFEGVANCLGPRWNSLWYFFSPVVPLFYCTIFSFFFYFWKFDLENVSGGQVEGRRAAAN